jgi:mRNA interferase YafQ
MLELFFTKKFKKDYKRCKKQGKNTLALKKVITDLRELKILPKELRDHPLSGRYSGMRECHIEPDFLLIYRIDNERLILTAVRLGSHSELF